MNIMTILIPWASMYQQRPSAAEGVIFKRDWWQFFSPPLSDKQTRAQAVTPLIEAGKVFLPQSASWVNDFVEEMAYFPNGIHDDVVDATTQALNYLRVKPLRPSILLGCSGFDGELDKEALWEKAMLGYPMSPEEIEGM
jgi:hypothetical protein